jgi:hypothetical protein
MSLQGKGIINNYIFFINIYFKLVNVVKLMNIGNIFFINIYFKLVNVVKLMNIGRNSYKENKINSAVQIQIKTYQSFFQIDH